MIGEAALGGAHAEGGSVFSAADYQYFVAFLIAGETSPELTHVPEPPAATNVAYLPVREGAHCAPGLDMRTAQIHAMVAYLQNGDRTDAQIKSILLRRYRNDSEMLWRVSDRFNEPREYLSA